ncbi:putative peptidyl-prolyl cis-trans isomerase [Planctomycetes bacterium Pla163]|uniref:peptidylprolyl isomerase n=1 Tax=Rohdeia mirabilis TaxID=2528008 RepID=A0A518D4P6_9BACT|nr:putative peptidyl-prolyl cis-trans isomerase [Planctomycetes bacterium Pla163]
MRVSPLRPSKLAAVALACAMVAACGTTGDPEDTGTRPRGSLIALPTRVEFAEIASLEEARRTGSGRLLELLVAGDTPVRARAAQALGRMPLERYGVEVTDALATALGDPDAQVRAAAARALGWRGDVTAAGAIALAWEDAEPAVRSALVDAAARIAQRLSSEDLEGGPDKNGAAEMARLVIRRLYDPVVDVRVEAISACGMLPVEGPVAGEIDRDLLGVLSPIRPRASGPPLETEIWLTLYALQRRRSEVGRGAYLEHDTSPYPEARIFAVRGLARTRSSPEGVRSLERAASDPDWRVAVEALRGLATHADESSLPSVLAALDSRSPHVRRTACEALPAFAAQAEKLRARAQRGLRDRSSSVRSAALVAYAEIFGAREPEAVQREIVAFSDSSDLVGRRAAGQAARFLPARIGEPLADRLLLDPEPFVSTMAIESLGEIATPSARARLRDIVANDSDNGRRLTAVLALRATGSPEDAPALIRAASNAVGDVGPELAWNALESLRAIGSAEGAGAAALGDGFEELLRTALRSQNPQVRLVARTTWIDVLGEASLPNVPPPTSSPRTIPLPGRDYPDWQRNPLVEVATTRGVMVFELFPEDAPLHVYSFVQHATTGHYDGTLFHRVVPDFVVQGGDYRGDGNGGLDWRGTSLRHEFTPRKFLRGSLGMPRNEWVDSGGSQIFVTHRPTPHLDGNYTLFGRMVQGFDVLDAIEEGDRIVSTRLLDASAAVERFGAGR